MLPILAVTAVLATLGVQSASFFNISTVSTIGDDKCVKTDYLKNSPMVLGQNLLSFSGSKLELALKKDFPCVLGVTTEKIFPTTLQVTIETASQLAKIDGTNLAITNGSFLTEIKSPALPVVFVQSQEHLVENKAISDPSLLFVTKVLLGLKDSDFGVSSVRIIDPKNIVVYNTENALAIFDAAKNLNSQLSSLQEVIAKSKIDAAKIEKIDLRFDKPVIVFK